MASIVDSLFGPQPWQIEQQQRQNLDTAADKYASQSPFQRASGQLYRAGGMLGGAAMEGMGYENPAIAQAKQQEAAMQGADLQTPEGLRALAQRLNSMGMQKQAYAAATAASQMDAAKQEMATKRAAELASLKKSESEASPFAKINPKDYTPESLKSYMLSRNPADLVAINPEGKETTDIQNYRMAVSQGYKGTFEDWRIAGKRAGASSTEVRLPAQEKGFETELGKKQAASIIEGRALADDAVQMLNTNKVGRSILDKGIVTGFGANAIVNIGQALKQAGIDFGGDATANSQAYTAVMAQNVGKLIKQFGAGTGLSDADREYATKMAGGLVTVDEKSIRKILEINDKAARNVIELHNKRVKDVKTNIPLTVDIPPEDGPPPPPGFKRK